MAVTRSLVHLITAAVIILLGSGFQNGYNATIVNLPQAFIKDWINATSTLRYNHSLHPAGIQAIWAASVAAREFGQVLGAGAAGWLCDRFGRTLVLSVNSALLLISNIAQGMSAGQGLGYFEIFFAGRFSSGLAIGVANVVVILYLNEIAPIYVRGTLGFGYHFAYNGGAAVAFIVENPVLLGTNKLWVTGFYVPLLFSVILGIAACCVFPDSPRYLLIQRGRKLEAEKSIAFYQGESAVTGVIDELEKEKEALGAEWNESDYAKNMIQPAADEKSSLISSTKKTPSKPDTTSKLSVMIKDRGFRFPMLLTIVITFAKAMCGNIVVMSYSTELLTTNGINLETAQHISSLIGCCMLIAAVVSLYLVEAVGRRLLVITGAWLCATPLIVMCLVPVVVQYACAFQAMYDSWFCKYATLSISAACLYIWGAVYSFGLGPCSFSFIAELWPQRYRATATSLAVSVFFAINILLAAAIPNLLLILKQYTSLTFTVPLLITAVYLTIKCPETKGKTNLEIVNELADKKLSTNR